MTAPAAVARWVAPAAPVLTGLTQLDLEWLDAFESDVLAYLAAEPWWSANPGRRGWWLLGAGASCDWSRFR